MADGCTQSITETSTRNISCGGKGDRCIGLTTLPPSCADYPEILEPEPLGTLRACPGLYMVAFVLLCFFQVSMLCAFFDKRSDS